MYTQGTRTPPAAGHRLPDGAGVAAVVADSNHVRWIGSPAVVTLPGHIDTSNASQICAELLSVIGCGATELIADMTRGMVTWKGGSGAGWTHDLGRRERPGEPDHRVGGPPAA
jgi:hypothetical protein